jgi:hypothetical protein
VSPWIWVTAELLEEEGNFCLETLVSDVSYPVKTCGTGMWTALSPYNDPVDSLQVSAQVNRLQQGFTGQEPYRAWHLLEIWDSVIRPALILDRDSHPYVLGPP